MNFIPGHFTYLPALLQMAVVAAAALVATTGCTPTINLATPDPIKVDVGVKIDVYQKTAPTKAKDEQSSIEIAANRRQRAPEVDKLKADKVVGEDCNGYLRMRTPPTDPKTLKDVEKIIDDENADRAYLYLANAQSQNKPLEEIERQYAQMWSDRALPGQWIQKENQTWIQK